MFGDVIDELAEERRVVAVELQGHGHTRDIDRPFSYEAFGDDLALVAKYLGLERVLRCTTGGLRWLPSPTRFPS
jgi:pimeloyl-ACP methyl ester carboxylesterase